jgi:extracellular elastinolytic metalloproteinase|tara:strand:+ start:1908 stop:4514 length:2607 start_codon:yes stop_codon:yes gene_type:complete
MRKNYSFFTLSLLTIGLISTSISFGQNTAKERIQNYFLTNSAKIPIASSSVNDFEIDRTTTSQKTGINHHYIHQLVNGLPVLNATAVFVEKNGNLILAGNRLVTGTYEVQESYSEISGFEAVHLAWENLTGEKSSSINVTTKISINGNTIVNNPAYSKNDIPVERAYFFDGNVFRYIYEMNIQMKDGLHWWNLYVDANTGEIIEKINWTVSCTFENCSTENHFDHSSLQKSDMNHQLMMAPAPPPQNDSYRVFKIPIESPNHGSHSLVVGPFNSTASPFGWHDDNGVAGAEYTTTRGNNVRATEDANDDDNPGYSPDGGVNLVFDFPYNGGAPTSFLDASITNLFYMNNIMHDVWYQYGFDEQHGNFQENNYGKGGIGSDYVNADAQDGSGTNNANFSTPTDGQNPRMQMFIWTNSATSDFLEINAPGSLIGSYNSSMASFAPQPPAIPITEDIIMVNSGGTEPMDACNTIINFSEIAGKIALVKRGSCTFALKVENCQAAGAVAVIVINNVATAPITMGGTASVNITIPAIMVNQADGNSFITVLNNNTVLNGSISDQNSLTATDSDIDNVIIAHEYGHGISNRLTGGPSTTSCLGNEDQMGEGWSDWFGLVLTIEPGDQGSDRRGVGTYVQNQPTTGNGIRPAAYSTSFNINGFTYSATNSTGISRPHGIGFVWCTALWDLTWDFIAEYGFDSDLNNGTGGNNKMMELVIEGLKLQPCNPGAVDGRDAILLADQLLNNGVNECMIWRAFAKRGLGINASQGNTDDRFDQIENFNMPLSCSAGLDENNLDSRLTVFPNPTEDNITITSLDEAIESITVLDINGRQITQLTPSKSSNVSIDMSNYDSGIYFVVVEHNNIISTRKIVKK